MGQSIGIMDTLLIVLFTIALFLALHLMETMKIMVNQWCYNPLRRPPATRSVPMPEVAVWVPVADWAGEEVGHNFMKGLFSRKQF
jgi:hypothetical protein